MSQYSILKIYITETDTYNGELLYLCLVRFFKKEKFATETAIKACAGFGKSSTLHSGSILRLSQDLPIVIEVVDKTQKLNKVLPKVKSIIDEGLIFIGFLCVCFIGQRGCK